MINSYDPAVCLSISSVITSLFLHFKSRGIITAELFERNRGNVRKLFHIRCHRTALSRSEVSIDICPRIRFLLFHAQPRDANARQ